MNKILVVVDMQNDFLTGSLALPNRDAIAEPMREFIDKFEKEDMRNLVMDSAMYDDVANDKAKANLPGKKLLFEEVLLNICLDGLVTNYPPNPQ